MIEPLPLPPPPASLTPSYAGFWIRVLAWLIDGIVLAVLSLPALIQTWGPIWRAFQEASRTGGSYQTPPPTAIGWVLLAGAISYLYALLMIGYRGATVGKFVVGIRVRRLDGTPAGWREAALRPLLQTALGLPRGGPFGLFVLLDGLWMLWDKRRQTLHDKIAGTIVVKR